MDSNDNQNDSSSSKTVIVWKNDVPEIHTNGIRHRFHGNLYRAPQMDNEYYLYSVWKTANDLVNNVVKDSEWIMQCSKNTNKYVHSDDEVDNEMLMIKNRRVEECSKRLVQLRHSDSSHSLLSKSSWLDENGLLDDQTAIAKISDFIEQNWNLPDKYMFTIKKINKVATSGSTSHTYEVEFSVPTPQYPIPQLTISAFFIVEVSSLFSLPVYIKYRLESDRRVYVVGKHSFDKNRFEQLFDIKRHVYMAIIKYPGWSSDVVPSPEL